MLFEKELVKEMKATGCCYALVVQKGEDQDLTIPPEATAVLKEYSDVIPEELPDGLPPK